MSLSINDLIYIIPGFIAYLSYKITIPGSKKNSTEELILISLTISVIEYLALKPLIELSDEWCMFGTSLFQILLLLIIPLFFGILLGKIIIWDGLRKLIGTYHPTQTAWDRKFSRIKQYAYVIVVLNTDESIYGLYEKESFAGDGDCGKDLLLTEVLNDDGSKCDESILIKGELIKYIRFMKGE